MRPLELEVQGFGPYATKQVVPFGELEQIFLIGGDTGAGKTTLFDAISYALYGRPLGTRGPEHVRSKLVDDRTPTYVRFRFACGGKTWQILRSPHWPRDAKRGSGVVVEEVFELREGDQPIPGKPKDLDARIERDVVRLSHAEFSKILVLPQGEFQRFLEMPSDARAEILEKLFPTEEHRRLTTLAKDRVAEVRRKVEELQVLQEAALQWYDPAKSEAREAELLAEVESAKTAEAQATEAAGVAARVLEAGRTLAGQVADLARAREEQRRHAEVKDQADAWRAELDASRRATRVAPALDAEDRLRGQIASTRRELEQRQREVVDLEPEKARLAPRFERIEADEDALRGREEANGQLARRIDDLRALFQAGKKVDEARAAVTTAEAARPSPAVLAEVEAKLAALASVEARRDTLAAELDTQKREATRLAALEPDAKRVEDWEGRHAPEREKRRASETKEAERLQGVVDAARREVEDARARLEAQAAALLAATLSPGEPCPVCGSSSHPNPAHGGATEDDVRARVKSAERALSSAQDALAKQAAAAAAGEATFAALEEAKGESAKRLVDGGFGAGGAAPLGALFQGGAGEAASDPAAWRTARAAADNLVKTTQAALDAVTRELQTRKAREDAVATARKVAEAAEKAVQQAAQALAAAAGARAELAERVGEVVDVTAEGKAAKERHDAEVKAIDAARAALKQLRADWQRVTTALTTATTRRDALSNTLAEHEAALAAAVVASAAALAEHGFAAADAARAARRDAPAEARLARQLDDWTRAGDTLAARIQQLVDAVGDRAAPDVAALELAARDAQAAARAATETRAAREAAVADLRRRKQDYDALVARKAELERGSAGLLQLAKDLSGENGRRIDFPTFILTWWLEQVLVRATARLRLLSEGRYAFALRSDVSDRRKRGGLDLDVFDAHAGDRRDVRTLSGGEKFLASLSLALGLADVIQERAGGIELDTLFIDEGFGTLDPSAMDRALQVIDEIGAHRRVGLISHVESIKKAIPCHVLVEKSPAGSRVRVGR
jgi:exonuclease SbcC